ncbi:MAG: hypothetical protein HC844_06175 [Tabrizicola sp.]|nr:hypothetical protein [Tabrizicola sp.]
MKIKLALTAIVLALAPAMSFAGEGCGDSAKEVTASSCISGTTWDEVKGACVANPSS